MDDQYTRGLAEFASSLNYSSIPGEVVEHAKLCLLDTVGCGLLGSQLRWSRILADCVVELEPAGACTLWGMPHKVSPTGAALVNGTMVHGFELDDLHKVSIAHLGSAVATAAISVAEHLGGVSGKQLVTAIVAGYEVGARAGMSVGTAHLLAGWHPTGTHGALGAGAAAGSLLGLSAEQMQDALGIAGTQAGGLMASQYGAMVKRFHAGRAAQSGVYAGLLARRGFTGIRQLFESEYGGYCTAFSPTCDRSKLVEGLGTVWETATVGFKPYSTNGSCHTTIDALLDMKRTHGLAPEQVEEVRVFTSSATKEHVGWTYVPDSVTTAQMNLSYIAAVVLTDGAALVDQFSEERIRDEKLVALSRRVRVEADPDIDSKGDSYRHHIRIEVILKDGRTLKEERHSARGSSAHPMAKGEVEAKYAALASRVLSEYQVSALRDLVYGLDTVDDVRQLAGALVPR